MEHRAAKQKACGTDDPSQLDDFNEIACLTREEYRNEQWPNTIETLKIRLSEKFALVLQAKEIEHERKLDIQKSNYESIFACIQDELDTERAKHEETQRTLDAERAEHEVTQRTLEEKSIADDVLMLTQNDLKTEQAEHAATKLELHAAQLELSIFNGIDSTKALADHITGMQVVIDNTKKRMERAYGPLDDRAELLLKDMEDTLLLKTPTNYKFLFMSEVACRMGFTFTTKELKLIGYQIAVEYKGLTGSTPNKHLQFVEGPVVFPHFPSRISTKDCCYRSCHCCEHVHG